MSTTSNNTKTRLTFTSRRLIIIACILIIAGYLLMSGDADSGIFSTRRIVVAPSFCLAGYLLIIVGILRST